MALTLWPADGWEKKTTSSGGGFLTCLSERRPQTEKKRSASCMHALCEPVCYCATATERKPSENYFPLLYSTPPGGRSSNLPERLPVVRVKCCFYLVDRRSFFLFGEMINVRRC
ncbi:hypothetical protein CEXT_16321 [Caerostris extrusa]|uniref:Uncharacterized protein n=1 Tax=Caerostris extrusa TaxID=172846 RepID=A0AAV4MAV6_CAEEX|nr:hypothetical protein CEXT_16321 [Caerostris extrusa]